MATITAGTAPPVHGHRVGQGRPQATAENNVVQAGQKAIVKTTVPVRAFTGTVSAGKTAIIRNGIITGVK